MATLKEEEKDVNEKAKILVRSECFVLPTSFFLFATASESTSELDSSCFIFLDSLVATFLSFSLILLFCGVGCCCAAAPVAAAPDKREEGLGVDEL